MPTPRPAPNPGATTLDASTEVVGMRNIQIPLPIDTELIEHSRSDEPLADDVWIIESDHSEDEVRAFYGAAMPAQGWVPGMPQMGACWEKPLSGTTDYELLCIRFREPGQYEIHLAPL